MTSNQAKTMDLINQYIDTHKEELFQHIQQAVRIKSVVGHEQEIQQFMKRLYEKIGLEVVEVIPDEKKLSTHEAFVDSGFPLKDRRNIIGLLQGSDQGKSLTLHGHVDVVSEGVTEAWT